jgi:hypothetical protein
MTMRFLVLSVALVLGFASGCTKDGYAELGLVPVTGTVTLDSQPLSGAKVVFESLDKRTSIGVTDAAGRYKLMYDSEKAGVTPGPKIVRITRGDTEVEGGGAAEGAAAAAEPIPARYNRKSELKADVSAGARTFDFALKSAP